MKTEEEIYALLCRELGRYEPQEPEAQTEFDWRLTQLSREFSFIIEGLYTALGGFLWLGNNLHQIKQSPDEFKSIYDGALEDARAARARAER